MAEKHMDKDNEPQAFLCPITHEVMEDPMIVRESNQTLSKSSAVKWFMTGKKRCPVSGCVLKDPTLVPNPALASLIKAWRSGREDRIEEIFTCPLTNELMRDPVLVVWSMETISRAAADAWIESGNECCPVTKKHLKDRSIIPNLALRSAFEEWERAGSFPAVRALSIPCGRVSEECSLEHSKAPSTPSITTFAIQTPDQRKPVPSRIMICLCVVGMLLLFLAALTAGIFMVTDNSDNSILVNYKNKHPCDVPKGGDRPNCR